jgi:hypothetical protein
MRDTGLDQTADLARDLQIEIIDHQGSSIGAPARKLRLIRHATKRSVPTRSITDVRHFRTDRVVSAHVLDEPFSIPKTVIAKWLAEHQDD